MPTYTFLAADLRTNAIVEELPLTGVTADQTLNGVGQFQATLDLGDKKVAKLNWIGATQTARSLVYIDRDGVLLQDAYILWTRSYDSTTKKLTLGGQSLWSYFRRRKIIADAVFAGQDQLAIARSLITTAQAATGGNIGVALRSETSGVLRDRTYNGYEFKPVGEAIEQLAAVINGFDFRINIAYDSSGIPAKTLVLGYPEIGQPAATSPLVFDMPGNIISYTYPEDSTEQDTTAYATGSGDGPAMLTSTAADTSLIDVGYPLLEGQTSYGDVVEQPTLDGHAQADLATHASPVSIPEYVVNPNADPVLGSYICGDYARFVITDERFPRQADGSAGYDQEQRITKISLSVPDAAGTPETVKLSCGGTS